MHPVNDKSARPFEDTSASAGGASASLTYEPFYGLREKPFSLSADPRFLFRSPSHARGVRCAPGRNPPPGGPHRPDGRNRYWKDDAVPVGAAAARSAHVLRLRAGSVRLPRRSPEDAAGGLRRHLHRRSDTRPVQRRIANQSELSALRVPRFAGAAAGVCRARHRRGAESVAASSRGDPHPLGIGAPREAPSSRHGRPTGAAVESEAAADAAGGSARLGTLRAEGARRREGQPDT